jgi:Peptidase family S41
MAATSGAILLCQPGDNKISPLISWRTALLLVCCSPSTWAQSPQPSATPAAQELVDSLSPAEIDETVRALKSNFVDPNALKDQEINRATLQGLLARLRGGVVLLPGKATAETAAPFYGEVLARHIGYARIGSLTSGNVAELDKALATFSTKKLDAIVVDLRASAAGGDFDIAAEIARRFVPKGKTMWTLHKTAARQDQTFTNDREPAFQGMTIGLIDGETSGAAEAVAAALKVKPQTLLIGQPSAGRAVEYSDFPLSSGKILRVAVEEVVGPDGKSLFPSGVKADLPVDMDPAQKRQIFVASAQRGMSPFVFESERPHFNEAALIAGTNPELESRQQRRGADENLHDAVLQRAVDVITSLAIFQKH